MTSQIQILLSLCSKLFLLFKLTAHKLNITRDFIDNENDLLQEDENENDYSFEDFELAIEHELEVLEYKLQDENRTL